MGLLLAGIGALTVGLAVLTGAVGLTVRMIRAPSAVQESRKPGVSEEQLVEMRAELAELKLTVAGLPSLWEAERERAEEAADRAKRAFASARAAKSAAERALAEREPDEGDDDDDDEGDDPDVLQLDALRSSTSRVQQLPEALGEPAEDDLTARALAAGWSPWL